MNTLLLFLVAAAISIWYISTFEWLLHRYVMHKPILGFKYAFEAHAKTHHTIFRADQTFHTNDETAKKKITMAWWNGPVLVVAASIIPAFIVWTTGLSWLILVQFIILCSGYYIAYESLHWCMHCPKNRLVESSWFFRKISNHHLLHHKYMNRNLNVVLPIADFFFGTLKLR